MMRKLTMFALAACVAAVAFGDQALSGGEGEKGTKAQYTHAVYFYLKKDVPAGTVTALIKDSHRLLAKIPTVRKLWVGRPTKHATPKYAISDYDVGLIIAFDDYAGLKTYLEHDLHLKYVSLHEDKFDKVLVYDFVNQNK